MIKKRNLEHLYIRDLSKSKLSPANYHTFTTCCICQEIPHSLNRFLITVKPVYNDHPLDSGWPDFFGSWAVDNGHYFYVVAYVQVCQYINRNWTSKSGTSIARFDFLNLFDQRIMISYPRPWSSEGRDASNMSDTNPSFRRSRFVEKTSECRILEKIWQRGILFRFSVS